MKRVGGSRRKTRHKLKKSIRQKGKISLSKYFQVFELGDKVLLKAEPAVQKGMFHPRFYGRSGEIIKKKGRCYEIKIKDGGKAKIIISHPIHLRKLQNVEHKNN